MSIVFFTHKKIALCPSTAHPKEIHNIYTLRKATYDDQKLCGTWGDFTVTRQNLWIYPQHSTLNVDHGIDVMGVYTDLHTALCQNLQSPNDGAWIFEYHPLAQIIVDGRLAVKLLVDACKPLTSRKNELTEIYLAKHHTALVTARQLSAYNRGEKNDKILAIKSEIETAYRAEYANLTAQIQSYESQIIAAKEQTDLDFDLALLELNPQF